MKIVINTPAGNIGRVVANQLLDAMHEVIVISRHPANCAQLVERGAHLVEGSIDVPAVLNSAFAGAQALFWVTPFAFDRPDYVNWALRLARTAADAARRHGLQRVVLISSVGAQHEHGVGPIVCCKPTETALAEAVPNVCSLRAASFMENFLAHVPTIAAQGAFYTPHPTDSPMPMVATRDIAAKAVQMLLDTSWSGMRIEGVHGPEDISHATAARIIGEAIGRPVRHVVVSPEDARQAMIGQGLPAFAADLLADMYQGCREGRMVPAEPRSPETTTPTTLRRFAAEVLCPAVQAAAKPVSLQK
jgi:uncharacterized protein YbjT (DUF2867 family)